MSVSAHPKNSRSWGLMDHTGILKLGPVGSLDPTQGSQEQLLSPVSLISAVFPPIQPKPRGWCCCSNLSFGHGSIWTYKHSWMEGLEKCSSFIETELVKLASEPSTEITWLQASCKAASPQSSQGEQSRRQGLHGSARAWGAGAAAAGQCSHIWENPALIFKAVCCGTAEYGNFISKAECLLCSSGCQHLARCHCSCQSVLAVFVKVGSQCFPTSVGLSNSCVSKGYGTREGMMLRCSRKANDQRGSYMGHFASVVE